MKPTLAHRAVSATVSISLMLSVFLPAGLPLVAAPSALAINDCSATPITESITLTADITSATTTCFKVGAAGITIDGNGHTVTLTTSGARLVDVTSNSSAIYNNVTVLNITSNGTVYVNGDPADFFTIQNSHVGNLSLYSADDAQVLNNTLTSFLLWGTRATVTGNTVAGTGQRLVDVMGDGALGAPSFSGCPARGDHLFTNNTFINSDLTLTTEATALAIRCSTNNSFTNNTFEGRNGTSGLLLKDGAEFNLFENNRILAAGAPAGALYFSDSSQYVSDPANNTFRRNTISGQSAPAMTQLYSSGGNRFEYNIISSGAPDVSTLRVDPSAGRIVADVYDHNTFYQTSATGNGLSIGTSLNSLNRYATHWQFTNNIVSYTGASLYDFVGPIDWTGVTASNNLYFDRTGSIVFGNYDFNNDGSPETISTLANWRTSTGHEANSLVGDPQFVNQPTGDYRILATSPAVGAGTSGTNIGAKETLISCTPNWQCTAWSQCSAGGTQTRVCTDTNACGVTTGRPAQSQSCTPPDTSAPSVALTAPTSGQIVWGSTNLSAVASDNIAVVGVQFKVNGTNQGAEDVSAPYLVSWNAAVAGTYMITAVARDAAGNTTTSSTITVTAQAPCVPNWQCTDWSQCSTGGNQTRVCTDTNACGVTTGKPTESQSCQLIPGDTTPPTLTISGPKDGRTVSGRITISVKASDTSGIAHVDFYVGDQLILSDVKAGYAAVWDTRKMTNGVLSITVKAYDKAGNMTAKGVTVTVKNRLNFTITSSVPRGPVSGIVSLTVTQFGGDPIARVEFSPSKDVVSPVRETPFQYAWNTALLRNGYRRVLVTVYDQNGKYLRKAIYARVKN